MTMRSRSTRTSRKVERLRVSVRASEGRAWIATRRRRDGAAGLEVDRAVEEPRARDELRIKLDGQVEIAGFGRLATRL